MKSCQLLWFGAVLFLLAGCGTLNVSNRIDNANAIAKTANFRPYLAITDNFQITGFSRLENRNSPITIYVEGDGFAWVDRYTISANPTPRNPIGLKLAVKDRSDNVLYLGRPCQFVDSKTEIYCRDNKNWTSHRFSRETLNGYNQTLNGLKNNFNNVGFHLVGFSGGGAIVTLLAVDRDDILSLRTVAGNLDHRALNNHAKVSPLSGSLNPIDVVKKIRHIPQIHFSGAKDTIVPAWIAKSFVSAVGNEGCVQTYTLPHAGHLEGWVTYWGRLSTKMPEC